MKHSIVTTNQSSYSRCLISTIVGVVEHGCRLLNVRPSYQILHQEMTEIEALKKQCCSIMDRIVFLAIWTVTLILYLSKEEVARS
jgi:hypothetical protein